MSINGRHNQLITNIGFHYRIRTQLTVYPNEHIVVVLLFTILHENYTQTYIFHDKFSLLFSMYTLILVTILSPKVITTVLGEKIYHQ